MQIILDFIHGTGVILSMIFILIMASFSSPSPAMTHQKQIFDSLPKYSNSSDYKIEAGGGIDSPRSYDGYFHSADSPNNVLEFYKEAMSKKGWLEKSFTKETKSDNGSTYADLKMVNGIDEVVIFYRDHGEFGIQVSKDTSTNGD